MTKETITFLLTVEKSTWDAYKSVLTKDTTINDAIVSLIENEIVVAKK